MTCDDINLLADDYVDGTCDQVTAASVRHHLRECAACRALAGDLARIRQAAATLGPIAPPANVWAAVQARVESGGATASLGDWRQLLAAAAGFALLVTGLSWLAANLPSAAPGVQLATVTVNEQFQLAEAAYQVAIDDLESITTQAEAPALAEPAFAALQASLVDLDEAIGEARGRLSIEPDDEFSQDSLLAALDNKVILLQDAVALLDQGRTDIEGSNP
jgi:predicted anti-sigma-YlaC factor YlaD